MPSRNNFVKLRNMRGGGLAGGAIDSPSPGIDFTQLLLLILVALFGFIAFHIYKTMNTPISLSNTTAATVQEQQPPVNVIVQCSGGGDSR
jgi:biopolymer transport protein ExbD